MSAPSHATIQAQLLFASGEKYLARKLAETERALRLLPFIYDARVVPVRYADGKVDIRVITKDVWTLSPGISFGRSGGTNDTKFNLQEDEFFGLGKDAANLARQHRGPHQRHRGVIGSECVRIAGGRPQLAYSDSSDGSQRSALMAQPFYSLDAPWSAKISAICLSIARCRATTWAISSINSTTTKPLMN